MGMLAYLSVGSSTWLAYAYVTLCQEVVTSGEFVTSQGVIDLYHFCVVVLTHVVLFMITPFGYLIVSSRGMKAAFGIGSGPSIFF